MDGRRFLQEVASDRLSLVTSLYFGECHDGWKKEERSGVHFQHSQLLFRGFCISSFVCSFLHFFFDHSIIHQESSAI